MRVLMVSDVYFPRINGVSTAIQTYRHSLQKNGIEVSLIAPDYGSVDRDAWIERVAARVLPFDPEDRLVRWHAMHTAVDRAVSRGCDLIHIQTPFVAHYAGIAAARRHGTPVIATYHTLFEEYLKHYAPFVPSGLLRGATRRFSRWQCNSLDAVIVPSQAIHARLLTYGVRKPMHILPTGIPVQASAHDSARADFRARHGIAPTRPVALFVGRVAHEKNIHYLLEVAALARASVPDLLLLIAGEGPALGYLQQKVTAQGLERNVQFIGYLDRQTELPACYAAADVFVFASRTETQGLVLLEAMAAGLPVLALAEMGTRDILGAKRGAVVPEDSPAAFARMLSLLLLSGDWRKRLAVEGREYAAEWSDERLAGRMAALYRQIVAAHARAQSSGFGLMPM
ncbi:glycosyltransferase [uncultured Propionivibrio sp.]|uniref:glycosyltransferase n=1 Tax=uncultured Propionivibrio sp. TaxID=426737 RepID=UPI0029BFB895|nr:glycosyltransferase [uncultured Propionivibrio sp.]